MLFKFLYKKDLSRNYIKPKFSLKLEQKWKRHRKLITPSFNARSVSLYVPIFSKRLKNFVETLSPRVGQPPFDIRSTSILVFIQMILDTTIGYNIKNEDLNVYARFLAEYDF